ncbi:transglutaminase domain-containing protein [Methanobacterium spitsbergense]|uniref:transglutaminase domain-containing protein n=1 Tax=Methanobacterium spitsbergense TaxID=2874285 RepID=UPI003084453E
MELAESITEDKETSWDKCPAIFCYVQTNYKWHDHDNTECSLNEVMNNKTGNCCELSRLEIAMVTSLDIDVEQGINIQMITLLFTFNPWALSSTI